MFTSPMVKVFGPNEQGRDFVVGDIHGHTALLHLLMRKAGFSREVDRLFSVGDLVDRGPDSLGALRLAGEPWFHAVRANHEDMLIRTRKGNPTSWMQNGGKWWLNTTADEREEAFKLALGLPLVIVVNGRRGRFNVLHAEFFGSDADIDKGEFNRDQIQTILWGRSIAQGFPDGKQDGLSTTFVGHTPVHRTLRVESHVFIDTGSFLADGRLTMIEPETGNEFRAHRFEIPKFLQTGEY